MGGGRAPCCDKSQVKRGPWSPAEDLRLIAFIQKHGHENWRALPKQAGLLRCGKSCRLRWINYLRPDVKRGNFTPQEEETIIKLHESLGNKWSKIASHLPGRTDNEIKNVWNTHLKKRLVSKVANSHGEEPKESSITSSSSSSSSSGSFMSYNDKIIGMRLGKNQETQGSVAKWPHELIKKALLEQQQDSETLVLNQTNPTNEAKEPSSSNSSSYDSKMTDSSDQVDPTTPEELMGSLYDYGAPYEVNNILQEEVSDEAFELPLESDSEFWNMLDNLGGSFQSNEAQLRKEVEVGQSSNFRDEYKIEDESRKWFRYLENELELDTTREENQEYATNNTADEPQVPETLHNEKEDIINPGMPYFQMWPPSPQSFSM